MKILLANKFYYRRGGDCIYTLNLEEGLKAHGHDVAVFAMQHPENLPTPWGKYFPSEVTFKLSSNLLETLVRPYGLGEVKRNFNKLLDDFCPDVVHANNIHSQLSPVIMELAKKRGIQTVWTLHDYKLVCPRYDCRKGKSVCELCFSDKTRSRHKALKNCIKNKCIKNSIIGSLIGYGESLCWSPDRLQNVTNAFICPSRFMADKLEGSGLFPPKMHVLHNFIDAGKCRMNAFGKDNYYCYVGRLAEEKGVKTLIEAANRISRYKLIVIGEGSMSGELQGLAMDHVTFTGRMGWEEIKQTVGKARFTVIPSEWYENCPLSVIESLCLGTPVLGARIGGIPELIDEPHTGLTFESGNVNDLACKIEQMFGMNFPYEDIAATSRRKFDAESYYTQLMNIYNPCS